MRPFQIADIRFQILGQRNKGNRQIQILDLLSGLSKLAFLKAAIWTAKSISKPPSGKRDPKTRLNQEF
jgi:hypothetical protein